MVIISFDSSAIVPLVYGVPQGLVVGPLLFIAYIEDTENTIAVYYLEHDFICR